jgi:predicted butyrate kinase (DUF1464 family)
LARALGIDPGTASFDLVVVDGERIVWEESIPSSVVAENPGVLVEAVNRAGRVDIIAGPSGYGSPVICNDEIVDPYTYALEVLLLTRREDLEEGFRRGEKGIYVYKALADTVVEFWRRGLNVCYIPSIILLPTIPLYRKLNRLDMGTADKLAVTALALYDHSREYGVGYEDSSFILVEMGFGYNAVIGVRNGLVVDGYGGTLTPMGFLTIGSLDVEVAVIGGEWRRHDVFYGGVSSICGTTSIEEALEKRSSDELCDAAFKAMIEGIERNVLILIQNIGKPREIILSGRLTRYNEILDEVSNTLGKYLPVRKLRGLPGSKISKEAGQGYALIGEGLAHGYFEKLVKHMKILEARGTVLDYIYHPRIVNARKKLYNAIKKSIKKESLYKFLPLKY